ncbi:hypothetical protein HDU93_004711 [Gonapodya sp. JEL0774]|nr:hypothetical protein HDU93_004711 [Gonapodya sp. JEL0774]
MATSDGKATTTHETQGTEQEAILDATKAILDGDNADSMFIVDNVEDDSRAISKDAAPIEYTPLSFALLFVGLLLAVFLASLDQTILAVAIPNIITDFQTFVGTSWIFTAFILTATSFIPAYGKACDIFGRKAVILFAIVVFEAGSAICGAATSMNMLIVGRAVAGLGGGGIFSLVQVIISDIVPLERRGTYQGLVGGVFGLASVVGPLMGGAFTYINLPLGAFTFIVVVFLLKLPVGSGDLKSQIRRMDFIGTFLLVLGIVLVLVPLSEGGNDYTWDSGFVIGLLIAGTVVLVAFVFVEAKIAVEPVIPLDMFKNRYVAIVFFCAFMNGLSFFTLFSYVPSFFQVVNGDTPTQAGVDSLALVLSLVVSIIGSGVFISATGIYHPLVTMAGILETIGAGLMFTLAEDSSIVQKVVYLMITGLGLGMGLQALLIAGQAAATQDQQALVTANVSFWQQTGGVIGVAIASAVFSNKLTNTLAELAPHAVVAYVKNNPSALRSAPAEFVPPDELDGVIRSYVTGLTYMFVLTVPYGLVMFFCSFFVKRLRLPKATDVPIGAA